jgi:hypothetical protein
MKPEKAEALQEALSEEAVEKKEPVKPKESAGEIVKGEPSLFDMPPLGGVREEYLGHLKTLGLLIEPGGSWKIWRGGGWVNLPKLSEWVKEGGGDDEGK